MEKIWCHFPKGRISDFVAVWERVITDCINWIMMHMRPKKYPLSILFLYSKIWVGWGAFEKPFLAFTQGELEPQFASKDSYLDQNIKQVCRSNCVRFLSFKKYYLRILSERITCTTIITRDKRQRIFLWETIKEKNPQLP